MLKVILATICLLGVSPSHGMSCRHVTSPEKPPLAALHSHWQHNLYTPIREIISELQYYQNPLPASRFFEGKQLDSKQVEELCLKGEKLSLSLAQQLQRMAMQVVNKNPSYQEHGYSEKAEEAKNRSDDAKIFHAERMARLLSMMAVEFQKRSNVESPSWTLRNLERMEGILRELYEQAHRAIKPH